MNIEYLEKAISILKDLGEQNLADEVRNILLFFLYTETSDDMDSDYDSDTELNFDCEEEC